MPNNHALYQVATKALLFDGDKLLVLTQPKGKYDFVGGRIDETEFEIPFSEALRREVQEELGNAVSYTLGKLAFVAKRFYTDNAGLPHHIIALYYTATYIGGKISLSDEHTHFEWVNPNDILSTPEKFVSNDEYDQFNKYFSK